MGYRSTQVSTAAAAIQADSAHISWLFGFGIPSCLMGENPVSDHECLCCDVERDDEDVLYVELGSNGLDASPRG